MHLIRPRLSVVSLGSCWLGAERLSQYKPRCSSLSPSFSLGFRRSENLQYVPQSCHPSEFLCSHHIKLCNQLKMRGVIYFQSPDGFIHTLVTSGQEDCNSSLHVSQKAAAHLQEVQTAADERLLVWLTSSCA